MPTDPALPAAVPCRDQLNPAPTVERHRLPENGLIPNSPLPLLIYRGALRLAADDDPAAAFEQIFAHWDWRDSWRNGIYPYPHYHSTTHEVLGIYAGGATVRFGGAGGGGITAAVAAGDVLVIPAGVGHCNLGAGAGLGVVGAYPEGRFCDVLRGLPGERPAADGRIAGLPLPANDPLHGPGGPLRQAWGAGQA